MTASWSTNTQKSYNTHLRKWKDYCEENTVAPDEASHLDGINFLAHLFNDKKASYGSITAARSSLSAILPKEGEVTFGHNEKVTRMIKGMFKLRPTLPRYTVIYDPVMILDYMEQLPDNTFLDMEFLTKKLVTLLCLLSAQRAQTIGALRVDFMDKTKEEVTFYIPTILKTTKPGKHQDPLVFTKFDNKKLCIVDCLGEYLKRTDNIRENLEEQPKGLILSYRYPHQPVTTSTIARYVKLFLGLTGIDITVFTTHSTRKASTSKANNLGLSLKDISKAAGWRSSSTFAKHYKLPIRQKNFGQELLKNI